MQPRQLYPAVETQCLARGHFPYVVVGDPDPNTPEEDLLELQVVAHCLGRYVVCVDAAGKRTKVNLDWLLAYDCNLCSPSV